MKQAAKKYLGTHNFKNFCKVDPSKTVNYMRTILDIDISEVERSLDLNCDMYVINLKGTAFLWHQVRCMAAVLFKIGNLEAPTDCIDHMLDVSNCTLKPSYQMAKDEPLVLYHCEFKDLLFRPLTHIGMRFVLL